MKVSEIPTYYEAYEWDGKHYQFGYPPDGHPDFFWISSLEERFKYVRENRKVLERGFKEYNSPIYLIKEMIQWGGSQNGVLQKFEDPIGTYCLSEKLAAVIDNIDSSEKAMAAAQAIPGLGMTYASKLLRFLAPDKYGALDDQIEKALREQIRTKAEETDRRVSKSECYYAAYIDLLKDYRSELKKTTGKDWKMAKIEMAIFQWAVEKKRVKKSSRKAD